MKKKEQRTEKAKKGETSNETELKKKEPTKVHIMPEVEDILSCSVCDYDTELHSELEKHMKLLHGVTPPPAEIIIEESATEVIEGAPDMCETTFICGECGENFIDQKYCMVHMESHNKLDII